MSQAAIHTTIRALSLAISQREKQARILRDDQIYDGTRFRRATDSERKERWAKAKALESQSREIGQALAELSAMIAKGYV